MPKSKKGTGFVWLACIFIVVSGAYTEVPNTIVVHGQLLDETGTPLTGDRAYEITFFDAEVDGNPLGATFTGTTQLSLEGIFDIPLALPEEATSVAELWYAIAVDSDAVANGIDGNDLFPNRIKVESVPFALQAATVESIPLLEGVATPVQEQLDAKANAAEVYTQTEIDDSQAVQDVVIAEKASLADVYTQTEIDDSQTLQDTLIAGNLARVGESYIIVETTDNAETNGVNLLAAYALAKTKTPHGIALSATNRVVVLVPPGNYDLAAATFPLDGEFVDVEGLSCDCKKQYIYGINNILVQVARDVRIANLSLFCEDSTYKTYYPGVSWNDGVEHLGSPPETEFHNCEFLTSNISAMVMRSDVEYAGKYTDCIAGRYAFGYQGIVSGTFSNCTGGDYTFGYRGIASGTFTNCTGGDVAFGGRGVVSGTLINCTGGFYAFGGNAGTASGTFTDCTGGDYAFGGLGGTASGTFIGCTGGGSAFGGFGGTASGTFSYCTAGERSFGGSDTTVGGTASGIFENCTGGVGAFGGSNNTQGGTANGTFTDCIGESNCFGSHGLASGTFTNCTGGNYSFAYSGTAPAGKFFHCNGGVSSFIETGDPAPVHLFCIQNNAQYSGND